MSEQSVDYAAARLDSVKPSASMAVSGRARELKSQGHDVIDLGVGEPDFNTPAHIIEAAYKAALAGQTRYTPTDGSAELKRAVSEKFSRENALDFASGEIIISNGAKQVIFDALMATMEPGQEVVLCAPYFDIYHSMTLVLGGVPITVKTSEENGFKLTASALEKAITPNTRWLFLNLPSNPAGATYTAQELSELGQVLLRHPQLLILSDEIYEHIIFDDQPFISFAHACPELRSRTLTVNGVSKAYAMTGWRIGYGAGPAQLITAMTKVQSQVSSGPCAIAQAGAVAALDGPQDEVSRFRRAFELRRDIVVNGIAAVPELTLSSPGGAFYTLIGCQALIGSVAPDGTRINNDIDMTRYLLDDALVASVPGAAYGLSPYFRLSTANSEDKLKEATSRIAQSVAKLKIS